MSSSEQEGVNRGVRMGFTWSNRHPSSHRRVSAMDASVVSWATPLLRSMFTFPTQPQTPARSSSSIRTRVASAWREENMTTRVVPLAMSSSASRRYTRRA